MKPDQLAVYRKQLLELGHRLDSEIDEIAREIATGGVSVGEHDSHIRESTEANLAIGKNEEAIQRDVRAALRRIELGTYGKCVDCQKEIPKARLDVLPYTGYCIGCETNHEDG